MTPAEQFLQQLPLIERAIASVVRRNYVSAADREDFASYARLKLIERDYRILRKFRERSKFETYLSTVISNLYRDYRNAQWGKWRPSAAAHKLGPLAQQLERLLSRDRLTFEEAVEELQARSSEPLPRARLEEIAALLPVRSVRQPLPEEALSDLPSHEQADVAVIRRERADVRARALAALALALSRLSPGDLKLVKLRFDAGLKVPRIADMLRVDAKPLYRQIDRLLDLLRRDLEAAGVSEGEIRAMLEEPDGPH